MSAAREMLCDTARAVFAEAATAGMATRVSTGNGRKYMVRDTPAAR